MATKARSVKEYKNFDPQIWEIAGKVVEALYQAWLIKLKADLPGNGDIAIITPQARDEELKETVYRRLRREINKIQREQNPANHPARINLSIEIE